jgi:putative ABC transport system substrate-binding protein
MRRREFITLLGGATAWPLTARGQQTGLPVIGFLHPAMPESYAPYLAAFRQALSEAGFVESRNVAIEFRWAQDRLDRLPDLAADLVRRRVAVIVAGGSNAAIAAKGATAVIPIVFTIGNDPVEAGLIASFNRPGGNATGTVQFNDSLIAKRLEMLHDLVPSAAVIGMPIEHGSQGMIARSASAQTAARQLGLEIRIIDVRGQDDFESIFASKDGKRIDALLVPNATLFTNGRERLVRACGAPCSPGNLRVSRVRHRRWPGQLWIEQLLLLSTYRQLCRPYPQGREACRVASGPAHAVRVGDQP